MAYALVGSVGTEVTSASGASITTLAFGQTPTIHNLLILWVAVDGAATAPAQPSGWSTAITETGTSTASGIFYKIAAGSDTAPTISAVTSAVQCAQLAEFSGNIISGTIVDQTGVHAGTTNPQTATAGAHDANIGELIIVANSALLSLAETYTLTPSSNNATLTTSTSGSSSVDKYGFGYGVGTAKASATTGVATLSTGSNITGISTCVATFKQLLLTPASINDNITTTEHYTAIDVTGSTLVIRQTLTAHTTVDSASISAQWPKDNIAGSTIVLWVASSSSESSTGPTDTLGNSFISGGGTTGSFGDMENYYITNSIGGPRPTVTVSGFSPNCAFGFIAYEIVGALVGGVLSFSGANGNSAAPLSNNITPKITDNIFIGAVTNNTNYSYSLGTNYSNLIDVSYSGTTPGQMATESWINTNSIGGSAYSASFTQSGSAQWYCTVTSAPAGLGLFVNTKYISCSDLTATTEAYTEIRSGGVIATGNMFLAMV
jgi:hypothetical protein